MVRWSRRVIVGCMVAMVATLVAPGATGAQEPPSSYVALGDSYTAGPLIPLQETDPLGCLRSDHNYPHLVAAALGVRDFRDPSCSGADTGDMANAQNVRPGPNPPQFDRLDADTQLVTVGIGGNDIGFTEISRNCSSAVNSGTPCQDHYVVNGRDEISERIKNTAPKVARVLKGIHQRSARARIFVVNYLPILPEQPPWTIDNRATGDGCHPQVPITDGDAAYVGAKQNELNKMLADQAAANKASLVDAYTRGIGHDACKPETERWVEPPAPNNAAAPLHPNLAGMQGTADAVVAKVG